jgi:hypothetical protein
MEVKSLKTAIEENILRNIPAEINKNFLNFLNEYKDFFSAINENNLFQINIRLRFYTPNRTFDTRLLISTTSLQKAEINISNQTLKDFAPSVRVTISVQTYEDIEQKVKNFQKFGIRSGAIRFTGETYYFYDVQRLISLDKYFIMEYFI